MPIRAFGQTSATATIKSLTMEAFVLNKSSLVIPGFLGTPAGIITTSAPFKESYKIQLN